MNVQHEMHVKLMKRHLDACQDHVMQYLETHPDIDLHVLQQDIISGCNHWGVYDAYLFARDISGSDVESLRDIVIRGGDYRLIYAFSKDVQPRHMTDIHAAFKTLTKGMPMSDALIGMRKDMIALHLEADDWASLICEYV